MRSFARTNEAKGKLLSKKNCAGKSLIQKIICDFFYHSVGSPNVQGQQL